MSKQLQNVKSWLRKADADWQALGILAGAGAGLREVALFHAQQAVEKWLKALLIFRNEKPPRTHDLLLLLNRVSAVDPELLMFETVLQRLTPFAVGGRYPSQQKRPTLRDIQSLLRATEQIREAILARMDLPKSQTQGSAP